MCVHAHVCVRAWVHACMCARVRGCMHAHVCTFTNFHNMKLFLPLPLQAVGGLSLSPGESSEECEQAVSAIATAVSGLKSQTVCLANRHRKKWREVSQRLRRSTAGEVGSETTGQVEEGTAAAEGREEEEKSLKEEGERTEEGHGQGDGWRGEGGGGGRIEEAVGEGRQQSGSPEVMELLGRYSEQLLEKYSEQLVELVREKTLRLSD